MKFYISADVLYNRQYEVSAQNQAEAKMIVENEEIEPIKEEQVTSPVLVYVRQENK